MTRERCNSPEGSRLVKWEEPERRSKFSLVRVAGNRPEAAEVGEEDEEEEVEVAEVEVEEVEVEDDDDEIDEAAAKGYNRPRHDAENSSR